MMEFWPDDASVFTIIKDGIIAVAAGTTAIIAWRGLRTWRQKLKGGTEYDLARRLLRAAIRTRNAIQWVRHPMMAGDEFPEDSAQASPADEEANFRNLQFAYNNRWKHVQEAVTELQAEQLEAEALWGQEILQRFGSLHKCVVTLRSRVENYLRHANPALPANSRTLLKDTLQVVFAFLSTEERDDFGEQLSVAMQGIEECLRPHIKAQKELLRRFREWFASLSRP